MAVPLIAAGIGIGARALLPIFGRAAMWSLRNPFKAAVAGVGVNAAADALTDGLATAQVTGPALRAAGEVLGLPDMRGAFGRAAEVAGAAVERNGLYAAVPLFMALKMAGGGGIVQAVAVGAVVAGLVRLAENAGLKAPGLSGLFNHAAVGIPADDAKINPVLPHTNIGYPPLGM